MVNIQFVFYQIIFYENSPRILDQRGHLVPSFLLEAMKALSIINNIEKSARYF